MGEEKKIHEKKKKKRTAVIIIIYGRLNNRCLSKKKKKKKSWQNYDTTTIGKLNVKRFLKTLMKYCQCWNDKNLAYKICNKFSST